MKKLFYIFLILSLVLFLLFLFFSLTRISGIAMEPSVKSGQLVVFRKYLGVSKPNRGDIVLYQPVTQTVDISDSGFDFVGRVVALPTESIRIENGNIYIDDNVEKFRIEEDYLLTNTKTSATEESKWVKLGRYEYFILTDSREKTIDIKSRIIPQEKLRSVLLFKFNK